MQVYTSHAHGKRLLSAGLCPLKGVIQYKGDAGEIAEVLQQGEEGKENRHGGQHDADDPRQNAVYPQHQQAVEPVGSAQQLEELSDSVLHPKQAVGEELGGIVRP